MLYLFHSQVKICLHFACSVSLAQLCLMESKTVQSNRAGQSVSLCLLVNTVPPSISLLIARSLTAGVLQLFAFGSCTSTYERLTPKTSKPLGCRFSLESLFITCQYITLPFLHWTPSRRPFVPMWPINPLGRPMPHIAIIREFIWQPSYAGEQRHKFSMFQARSKEDVCKSINEE